MNPTTETPTTLALPETLDGISRSADFQSAVSPNSIRLGAEMQTRPVLAEPMRISNPRYSRMQSCATNPTPSSGDPLPDLCRTTLDEATLDQLFRDLEHCAEIIEIIPKYSDRRMVSEPAISLTEARDLLASGQARGVQIRYRYEDAEWWDTLKVSPAGVRLVRIRHEF
jgi:hypothetical protein